MKVLCEEYEVCLNKEMKLPEDERCPHIMPHEKSEACKYLCGVNISRIERILNDGAFCREIILKKD